jgi:hypothetical protein
VERCHGEYLIFLDTDDLLAPHCLAQRVAIMDQHPDLDFAIFPCELFHKVPGDLGVWWNIDTGEDLLTRQFKLDVICQGTGVIWKKSSCCALGLWDESLPIWQDVDLFLRAFITGQKYKVCFDLPRDLHYRKHPQSISSEEYFSLPKLQARCDVYKKNVTSLASVRPLRSPRIAMTMARDLVLEAASAGQFAIAEDVLNWSRKVGVLNSREVRFLAFIRNVHRLKLTRIPYLRKALQRFLPGRGTVTTLCQVPIDRSVRS